MSKVINRSYGRLGKLIDRLGKIIDRLGKIMDQMGKFMVGRVEQGYILTLVGARNTCLSKKDERKEKDSEEN